MTQLSRTWCFLVDSELRDISYNTLLNDSTCFVQVLKTSEAVETSVLIQCLYGHLTSWVNELRLQMVNPLVLGPVIVLTHILLIVHLSPKCSKVFM